MTQASMIILVLLVFCFAAKGNPLKRGSSRPFNSHTSYLWIGLWLEFYYSLFDLLCCLAMPLCFHGHLYLF
jgi:hypothetical protein